MVSQAGVAAVAVGVVSAAAGPICGKTVPIIFLFFNEITGLIIFVIWRVLLFNLSIR